MPLDSQLLKDRVHTDGSSGSQLKPLSSQLSKGKSSLKNPSKFAKIKVNQAKSSYFFPMKTFWLLNNWGFGADHRLLSPFVNRNS